VSLNCCGSSLIYDLCSIDGGRGEVLKVVTGGGGVPRMLLIAEGGDGSCVQRG
jgi:hypothetical protein